MTEGRARLAAWLVALAAALAGLHALGNGTLAAPPFGDGGAAWQHWLDQRGPAAAAFAVLRLVALGLGWYLLITAWLATALRLGRATRGATMVEAMALPSVRRLVHAAAGVSLSAAALTTTAGAVTSAGAADDADIVTMRRLPDPAPMPTMRRLDTTPAAAPAPPPAPEPAGAATWTVRPGDHFWRIAEEVLTAAWGRPPTDGEVTPYWSRLVDHNRSKLADPDDPDLVFPGQEIDLLPPPTPF